MEKTDLAAQGGKVTVYTMPNCQPCKAVKRWLDTEGVEYNELEAKDHIEYLSEMGYRQAPVTVLIDGSSFYGFNVGALSRAF